MIVREESASDHAAIHALIAEAFGRDAEAGLVDALRQDGDLVASLVATETNGVIVGHIALSRLRSPSRALALAPIAVALACRRRGVGAALVHNAIEAARRAGECVLFVLGDPGYYTRFGFSAAAATPYACAYAGPHFMALQFGDRPAVTSAVVYASAFDGLGPPAIRCAARRSD